MAALIDLSPADLVKNLTEDELQGLRENVSAGRVETAIKALHERGAGARLVEEQYMGRYPLELIQNANDAAAAAGCMNSRVRFVVTPDALVVADEGSGFGTRQILAICGLASSSKNAVESIGYKGLGFKSVGEITDTPQIISGDVRFCFDEIELRRRIEETIGTSLPSGNYVPAYATPFALTQKQLGNDAPLVDQLAADGFSTVLRLPFNAAADSELISQFIARVIQPELLLYMTAIGSISVSGTTSDFTASIQREINGDTEAVTLWRNEEPQKYILVRTAFPIGNFAHEGDLGRGWENVTHARLAAAVRLDAHGAPSTRTNQPLSVYFPTEETTGTSILINGDFQVELDRRRLAHKGAPGTLNQYLAEAVAQFLSGRFLDVLIDKVGNFSALLAYTRTGESTGFGRVITEGIYAKLRLREVIPCVDGKLRKPSEVLLEPVRVPSVETAHKLLAGLTELVSLEISSDPRLADLLIADLGATRVGSQYALRNMDPTQIEMMEFYDFIQVWSRSENVIFRSHLRECKCVQLGDGTWVRPSVQVCYLPSAETSREPFNRVDLPLAQLPADQTNVDVARKVLIQAGLEPFTPRSFVVDQSIPSLGDRSLEPTDRLFHLSVLHAYYDRYIRRQADSTLGEPLKNVLLPARDHGASKTGLRRAGTLYFGTDIDPDDSPELIYGSFGQLEFFDTSVELGVPMSPEFLDWIGVARLPRLVHVQENSTEYLGWRNSAGYLAASGCVSGGHPRSQRLTASPTLDRLPQLLARRSESALSALWNSLASHWIQYEHTLLTATWSCSASQHKPRERNRNFPSPGLWLLTSTPWVPIRIDGGVEFLKPEQLWSTGSSIPHTVREHLPQLPASLENAPRLMEQSLNMRDASDIGPKEMSEILQLLPGTQGSSEVDCRARNDAARWVIETLRRFDDLSEIASAQAPLPARQQGELVYTPRPYFTAHPSNEEAWGDQIAFLACDATDISLAERLQLPVVEALLSTQVESSDRNGAAEALADQTWRDVSVEALALVARSMPSKLDEFARQFSSLSFECISHLAVVHSLPGYSSVRENSVDAYVSSDLKAYMRTIDGHLSWSPFSIRLAEAIGALIGDSLAVLLLTGASDRDKHLRAHGVLDQHVVQARDALDYARQAMAQQEFGADASDTSPGTEDSSDSDASQARRNEREVWRSPATNSPKDNGDPDAPSSLDEVTVNPPDDSASAAFVPSARPADGAGRDRDPLTRMNSALREAVTNGESRGVRSPQQTNEEDRPGPTALSPGSENDAAGGIETNRNQTSTRSSYQPSDSSSSTEQSSPRADRGTQPDRSAPQPANVEGLSGQPRQSRWMSYVVPQESPEAVDLLDDERRARELGDLGALAVMQYERIHGRLPEMMEHNNKGFDIISRDSIGDVVRYIEVKATSGRWSARGVAVSSSQVDFNRHLGDLFWLYVVEDVEATGHENINTICNPASFIDYYMFDSNWRALSRD